MIKPLATYRIQITPNFGFGEVKKIIPYLARLGINQIYASPVFKAKKGSIHGYDIVDPTNINAELGTIEEFYETVDAAINADIGWLQDIVPNHMAYDSQNEMLMDVLVNGKNSKYFNYFDIEWNHPYESIRGRLVAPFLGRFYSEVMENGEIFLKYENGELTVNYYDRSFPLKTESYLKVFTHNLAALESKLGKDSPSLLKFIGNINILKSLFESKNSSEHIDEQIKFVKKSFMEIYAEITEIKNFIDANITLFNGKKGMPESFNLLDAVLSEQIFRLSFWKVAADENNYRRFFNINELISLRIEDDDVFKRTHELIFKFLSQKTISGLRIDHIDGLYDPAVYLEKVRSAAGHEIYIVVEKILQPDEELPSYWPVQGTTGYDFLNLVNGIFCRKNAEKSFSRIYYKFTGIYLPYETLVCDKKRMMIGKDMAGDIDNLARIIKDISGGDRYGSDVTLYGLKRALVEIMAVFPVYRTYINQEHFDEHDKMIIASAIKKASEKLPDHIYELNYIERFLLLKFRENATEEERQKWLKFVMRFQQFTGPLMAKGFEDTVLYIYNRLISLNEVGGDPGRFGFSDEEFHKFSKNRANLHPLAMNATASHDTKRGEDVRARINVLSELPMEWERNIKNWRRLVRKRKKIVNGSAVPDKNDEYFFYQTLIGTYPWNDAEYTCYVERIKNYMIKAVREAKVHTTWLKPDAEYENVFLEFIDNVLLPSEQNQFIKEFLPFQKKIAHCGIFNSISQTLIKMTSPGVPDFYQGSELWDFNLVDPDNRRPVDFEKRERLLNEVENGVKSDVTKMIAEMLSYPYDGKIKMFLIYQTLEAIKENQNLFQKGRYIPLESEGKFKDNIVAFARNYENDWAIVVVPRFLSEVIKYEQSPIGRDVWQDTAILMPSDSDFMWNDTLSKQILKNENKIFAGDILKIFPAALLTTTTKN